MIGSVDDKVLSYFPDYQVKRGEQAIYDVTVKHLLTMRAPYKGKGDPWSKVCSSLDWTKASLDFNMVVAVSSYFKPTVLDRVDFIEDVLLPILLSSPETG